MAFANPAILRPAAPPRSGTSSGDRAENDGPEAQQRRRLLALLGSGQDRTTYADAIRDWVDNGANSPYRLTPDQVVATSQPRPREVSEAGQAGDLGLWWHHRLDPCSRAELSYCPTETA